MKRLLAIIFFILLLCVPAEAAITTDGTITKDPNSSTGATITSPAISGGTINNAIIGGTTPAAGAFTTLTAGATNSLGLGTAGSAVGQIKFYNATSGSITLAPVTGALGTPTLLLGTTFTDTKYCTYSTTTGFTCNAEGGAGASISGTPAQYQWGEWVNATTIKGTAVTASKVVCTDANGSPTACTNLTDSRVATDLSITDQAAGDILYFNGTNWVRMAKGANSSIFGVNSAGTLGFFTSIMMDDSAAQFKSATASKGTLKVLLSTSTDGKLMTLRSAHTDDKTLDLPDATDTLVGKATTDTLTNKTLDVDGTGNVLKTWGYIVLANPTLCAAGAPMQTTNTARVFGQCKFGNATDKATNYAEYILTVPPDIDTSVDLTAKFKFILSDADTGDHEYEISMISIADSADNASAPSNAVSLAYTADASGASGDVETAGETTLTDWKSNVTAGNLWYIRVARDGDHANDGSTVDSYSGPLVIKYKKTQ